MKAAQIDRHGPAAGARAVEGVPPPAASPDHVLVDVHAAGVNPFDWKVCEGVLPAPRFPLTLGADFSGVVTAVGPGVQGVAVGDEVYGLASVSRGGSGSFAEVASVDAAFLGRRPARASHVEAAALPMAGLRAWMVVHDHLRVEAGQRILIHGGAGGLGSMAIQMAKRLGARVAATASARDLAFVRALGADEAIDHRAEAFEARLGGLDAVFDTVGGETFARSLGVLRRGGRIVSMLARPDPGVGRARGVEVVPQGAAIDRRAFEGLSALVDGGGLRPHVDRTFALDEVGAALAHQKEGHPRGKVVVRVR